MVITGDGQLVDSIAVHLEMEAVPAVSSSVEKSPQNRLINLSPRRTRLVIRTNAQNWKPM
jgi:hypothetical protein